MPRDAGDPMLSPAPPVLRVPMSAPDLTDLEREAVTAVLFTPQLSIGPRLEEFERALRDRLGGGHCIAVSSGTAGLHLTVIACGVGAGDAVITTPFSFVASANAVLYERAHPVFVDVEPEGGNLDPARLAACAEDLVSGGLRADGWLPRPLRGTRPRLAALLPVDVLGQPADHDAIAAVADRWGVPVVEDACEAIGAAYRGRPAGTLGDAAVFAFYPNKQVTTGEGGMVVTARDDWAALLRSLRNQGRDAGDGLCHSRLGYNYRLDELSAALGRVQLERLDELLRKRERVAGWYRERLAGLELVERPRLLPSTTRMSWFVYVVRILPPADRDEVMRLLGAEGIPSRPYFRPIHLQPFYVERYGYRRGDFPVSERLGDLSLALPFSGVMSEGQVDVVATRLAAAVESSAGCLRRSTDHRQQRLGA